MKWLYNISIYCIAFVLEFIAIFNQKIKLFTLGRKETFSRLSKAISSSDQVIWFHCASLGEFEQGRPLIESIKSSYPLVKIVLTFFSPSGYEVQKEYPYADAIVYLPLDSKRNAKRFLEAIHPKMAIFIKYEFWPNMLFELKKRKIETFLVSGIFRSDQVFFKPYGTWMRNSLKAFAHFFVQNEASKTLINSLGFNNSSISGDTRFDRVYGITKADNKLSFIEDFIQQHRVFVAGSTWPKDEALLAEYINGSAPEKQKFIIAPHNISTKGIESLKKSIKKETTLFSDKVKNNKASVLIIDTVGLLSKIYSYANIAYVGGGFEKDGIHNILEPATFGVPLIIGPRYAKFQEATDLVQLKACKVVENSGELEQYIDQLNRDDDYRRTVEKVTKDYVLSNLGATEMIVNYISKSMADG